MAALGLALGACAENPQRVEQPIHHYSKDAEGNRLACYATDVASEYECIPTAPRAYPYAYAYDPWFYDPFWPYHVSFAYYYGWPHSPARPYWRGPPPRRHHRR